jgi:hypothetical protein
MRNVLLLFPVTALVAVVAGCGSQGSNQAAASQLQRDLTLASPTGQVDIASPVELRQVRTHYQTVRTTRRSGAVQVKLISIAVSAAPSLSLPVSEPVAQPASAAPDPANDRELPPGKTVTLIPASSGPSTASDPTDELPQARGHTMLGGGGGTCRGRGRGPGIGTGAPRPDFR